jgi:hypothetical protein
MKWMWLRWHTVILVAYRQVVNKLHSMLQIIY